ncbi:hypothetical protein PM082_014218 [Marasmius tenuissimus]|nr:hypothetical protein PM082_014218 [Marasmius tenuissimus]
MNAEAANLELRPNKATESLAQKKATGAVESVKLYIPSELSEPVRKLPELQCFVKMEVDFWQAQMETSLEGIRSLLFGVMARNNRKIAAYKAKYRQAWDVVNILMGSVCLPQLHDNDVRSFNDIDTKALQNCRKVLGAKKGRGSTATITAVGS